MNARSPGANIAGAWNLGAILTTTVGAEDAPNRRRSCERCGKDSGFCALCDDCFADEVEEDRRRRGSKGAE